MNAQIGKDADNEFGLQNLPNKNSEYLADFSLKNRFSCQNAKFKKTYESIPTKIILKHS